MTAEHSQLGKQTHYKTTYDSSLLFPIPRQINRDKIGLDNFLPFQGFDIWNGYELSWLNDKGKPVVAILELVVPCDSPNLIESKSLKLYLNSFNQTKFANVAEVKALITRDLSSVAGKSVKLSIILPQDFNTLQMQELAGECIDELDVAIDCYQTKAEYLSVGDKIVEETLVSHLLRSNCLVTNQPDWGTVQIYYYGYAINHEGLLKYIISFREHNEFHEHCVERIFVDIMNRCRPEKLAVYARYTRRGGLDINPMRANFDYQIVKHRTARQ